jgi:potassium-dependent mechanosensitive channel
MKKIRKLLRAWGYLSIFALVAVCWFSSFNGFAAEQKTATAPKDAPPEPTAAPAPPDIPLADIAARATEASNLLRSLAASGAAGVQIDAITRALPELSEKFEAQFAETTTALEAEPSLETLQTLQQQWQRNQADATALLNTLTIRATRLQNGLNQLADLQKTWNTTRAAAQASKAPLPILEQIDSTLKGIGEAQAKLQTERAAVLDLQSRIGQELTKCGTALAQIGQHQQKAVAGIFVPDAPPVWDPELWARSLEALPDHMRKVAIGHGSEILKYIREPREGSYFLAGLFFLLALVFAAARRQIAIWKKSGATVASAFVVFERPYAAALAITLLIATSPFFHHPRGVHYVLSILAVVPMLRLARPGISAPVAAALYALCFLFAVDTVRQAFQGMQVIGRVITVGETIAAIVLLFGMRHDYRQIISERAASSGLILLKAGRFVLIVVLLVALFAGMVGYASLLRILTPGILVGGVLALAAFVSLRVIAGVLALAFRAWPLRLLQMVENHRELMARRIHTLLVWAAIGGWLFRYLNYLGLLDPAKSSVGALLATKLERGTLSISLGNILEFFLVVFLAYLLSRFLRFALQEDVYPRINLAPGQSYAVSSLLNYIILALGFVAALGVLGADFSKVSILAGAFGVGIGFGLQSVVNNFVSGLILLFERPIQVGDVVQVGTIQGRVNRIGMRASVVATFQGAEIIVPNAQLITQEVTNWTRSDKLRRVELPVGVSYGAAPKKVIEVLEQVARAHPNVLRYPPPQALFLGYGDSSINFELRAWSDFVDSVQVRSDLAAAVYDAVIAAGLSFPFPQREVRLLRGTDATKATVTGINKE